MKRNTLFFLFFLIVSVAAKAQLDKPHFISLNVGSNLPLADYKEVDSVATGAASNGIYYSFETAVYLNKFFGIGGSVGTFTNNVNEDDIVKQVESDLGTNQEYEINSSDWVNSYYLIGPYFSFGGERLIVDFKFLAGYINSQKPLIDIQSDKNGTSVVSKSEESSSASFGFGYGLHLRIKLIGKLGLRLNAEGFSTKQEFDSKIEANSNGTTQTEKITLEKEIQALNLGAGLVLTF
tara:strand:- start:356 stop:1063 length:708 start_codon:yes stop_codon:yes gene_type:complete